mmetsp:Transcript_11609/g.38284  ORF Transcript_11609/g.38284 Transcript_11609/m.38284 type:complete len:211 (+) Transcript_11609:302-934(+)
MLTSPRCRARKVRAVGRRLERARAWGAFVHVAARLQHRLKAVLTEERVRMASRDGRLALHILAVIPAESRLPPCGVPSRLLEVQHLFGSRGRYLGERGLELRLEHLNQLTKKVPREDGLLVRRLELADEPALDLRAPEPCCPAAINLESAGRRCLALQHGHVRKAVHAEHDVDEELLVFLAREVAREDLDRPLDPPHHIDDWHEARLALY